MIYLNLGCGSHVAPSPWVNVDCSYGTAGFPCFPDVLCDIRTLPWQDGEVDAVYAGHVLEHLADHDARAFESRFAVADFRIRHNVLPQFDALLTPV